LNNLGGNRARSLAGQNGAVAASPAISPKPVVFVDTREHLPFEFAGLNNWIEGTVKRKLDVGDYSIVGMERLLRIERKSLTGLIFTLMQHRESFSDRCKDLAHIRHPQHVRQLIDRLGREDFRTRFEDTMKRHHIPSTPPTTPLPRMDRMKELAGEHSSLRDVFLRANELMWTDD